MPILVTETLTVLKKHYNIKMNTDGIMIGRAAIGILGF
jgi:hypothetical protein